MNSTVWCFTINNPKANDLPALWPSVQDAAWQLEEGESGTPHLQGFVRFSKKSRLSACKKIDAEAHWEPCRDPAAAVAYSTKESTRVDGPWTIGNPDKKKGSRSDLEHAVQQLQAGVHVLDLILETPNLVRYKRHLGELSSEILSDSSNKKRKTAKASADLLPWQAEALEWLEKDPEDRCILWIYDTVGNVGKSWFADYLGVVKEAFVVNPGKKADIAHAYMYQKIVVFDCSRTASEGGMDVVYGVAEDFKNGRIFSPKYDSGVKVFSPPHVVFFSNDEPNWSKWSKDRYKVFKVVNNELVEEKETTNGFAKGFIP